MRSKVLFVSGNFDDSGGKPSSVAKSFHKGLGRPDVDFLNGGNYLDLVKLLKRIDDYRIVIWMANVPNDKPKIVGDIKKINPFCILVTSKRNTENKYSFLNILDRALFLRSNLVIEISSESETYVARVLDPLGNVYCDFTNDFVAVGLALSKRISALESFTRIGSESVGDMVAVPNEEEFFKLVRGYADRFHEIIHANDTERLLGNASFRCERGFPSFKDKGAIYVSRRNIDKRYINKDGFVAIKEGNKLGYYGSTKPSVDSPIQVKLYKHYKNINYMLHSHVYVEGAIFTDLVVPCGAIEEVDEIVNKIKDRNTKHFSINLRGHGSLVASEDIKYFKNIKYVSRKIPESQY